MSEWGPWEVAGSYFEACNCEAVCPCRRQGDQLGGPSSYGVCQFALSWAIERGHARGHELAGLEVVLAGRYFDDDAVADGRPLEVWEVALYLDERASPAQAEALEAIFLGRAGGTALQNFAAAIGEVHAVRRAAIRLDHRRGQQRIEVPDLVRVRAREPAVVSGPVSCGIPGHDRPGEEWVADRLRVADTELAWDVTGRCAFAADFSYGSDRTSDAPARLTVEPDPATA